MANKLIELAHLRSLAVRTKTQLESIKETIPTSTNDLTNDSGFITNAVADLINYYTKNESYTKSEVNSLVSAIPHFSIAVVAQLPVSDISTTTIYLVPSGEELNNIYTEWIYVNSTWEKLGEQRIDLSGYALKAPNSTSGHLAALDVSGNPVDSGIVAEQGKVLSTNDYTTAEKNKLAGIQNGATNVSASSTNGNILINGVETIVFSIPSDVIRGTVATSQEVSDMLSEVFDPGE